MDKLLEYISKHWDVLSSAPLVFISVLILSIVIAILMSNFIYKEKSETLKEQINTLREQINVLKERLTSKDDQVNKYRQRLHLVDTDKTLYSQLSNEELRTTATKLISNMHESDFSVPLSWLLPTGLTLRMAMKALEI